MESDSRFFFFYDDDEMANYAGGAELAEASKAEEETGRRCGWPEYEFNGTRNELRSRSMAGCGVAKWSSRTRGDVKSGRGG